MKNFQSLVLATILGVAAGLPSALAGQTGHHLPTPPEPLDPETTKQQPSPSTRHVDPVRLQKEADDLARTAQSIPADIASVRQGMLPKDVIEKLKQIEKLSKRIRSELNP